MTNHRGLLYCSYDSNTNETGAVMNEWNVFPYPTGGYQIWRNSGHFTIDPTISRFTWTASHSSWVEVHAVCNIFKGGSAVNISRNVKMVWRKNGIDAGPIRSSHMNNVDCQVISGSGWIFVSTGDYLEPFITNSENNDTIRIESCSYSFAESHDW